MKNMRRFDRLARLTLGVLAVEAGLFWFGGGAQVAAYAVGAILVATAISGFCPVYRLLGSGFGTAPAAPVGGFVRSVIPLLVVLIVGAFAYASQFATRKFFLEEFNAMNNEFKQTLFHTSRNERAPALRNYEQLVARYTGFSTKYASYRPWALRGDTQFGPDLQQVAAILTAARTDVATGDLQKAHLGLEQARPLLQGILKRNNFSLLAVALVDFHDPMELIIEAAEGKDASKIGALYAQVSASLKVVEAEANDGDIQAIRRHLEDLQALALAGKSEALPSKADQLKRSFAKVYLARG